MRLSYWTGVFEYSWPVDWRVTAQCEAKGCGPSMIFWLTLRWLVIDEETSSVLTILMVGWKTEPFFFVAWSCGDTWLSE